MSQIGAVPTGKLRGGMPCIHL